MPAAKHINKHQSDPFNPYITDKVTHWDKNRNAFITTVYGLNPEGKKIVKYQVQHYPKGMTGPDWWKV